MKNRYIFIGVFLVFFVIGFIAFFLPSISKTSSPFTVDSSWVATSSSQASWRYPLDLHTQYVSVVDWPPRLNLIDQQFTCTEVSPATTLAGETKQIVIDRSTYCRTEVMGAAAGSIYTQYTYAFPEGTRMAFFTFTLRYVQCDNYEEPQKSACKREQASFDVNSLADGIRKTVISKLR